MRGSLRRTAIWRARCLGVLEDISVEIVLSISVENLEIKILLIQQKM